MSNNPGAYVVLTPAKNEEKFIGATIESMVRQVRLPLAYVIINDGSTDRTEEIIKSYQAEYDWIKQIVLPEREVSGFDGKVNALRKGYESISDLGFDFMAVLDADITFDENHFAYLLEKMSEETRYGIIGVPFQEGDYNSFYSTSKNIHHVSGACQFFRRSCFEEIGGYTPIPIGGEDRVIVLSARMNGWQTRTFPERNVTHNRIMGVNHGKILSIRFKQGRKDYLLGNAPVWQLLRFLFQLKQKPLIIGSFAIMSGYLSGYLKGIDRPISQEMIQFIRKEQRAKIRGLLRKNTDD